MDGYDDVVRMICAHRHNEIYGTNCEPYHFIITEKCNVLSGYKYLVKKLFDESVVHEVIYNPCTNEFEINTFEKRASKKEENIWK